MAKPIKIPAQIDLTLHNLKDIRDQLDILNKNIGTNLSDTMSQQLVDLSSFIDQFVKENEAGFSSGKMKTEELKNTVKVMNEIISAIGKVHKGVEKEITSSPHSFFSPERKQQIKEVGDEIVGVGDKIDEILKRQTSREEADFASLQSSTRIKDLALDHLVNYDAMLNKLIRDEKTYQKLRLKSQEGKLSSTEKQRLATLQDTAKARQYHIRQAEESNQKTQEETKVIEELVKELTELKNRLAELENQATAEMFEKTGESIKKMGATSREGKIQFSELQAELDKSGLSLNIFSNLLDRSKKNLMAFLTGVISGKLVITGLKKIAKETVTVIKDLDKAFNEMAMVTTMTNKEAWQLKGSLTAIASATGHTITEVTELSVQFFRQGRSISETIKLTEAAASAAKVAGISVGDSVNYLTSAVNGFHLSANQAMVVSDKFAALAASSASSYEELAKALSKVAAQAYTVGVNMDNLMAFIAKGLEVTREAPENIGTAFKTIFARMAELKDIGKTMEDGMSIGRVDTALKQVGVSLTNTNGEIRNLDEVLIELGNNWDNLTKNQKAYVAVALAGTRQQARLLAVMEDFGRTMDLVEVSQNSLGATLAQQEKYTNSLAFAINEFKVAWQDIVSSLGSAEIFTVLIKIFADLLSGLHRLTKAFGGLPATIILLTSATLMYRTAMKSTAIETGKSIFNILKHQDTINGFVQSIKVAILQLLGLKGAHQAAEAAAISNAATTKTLEAIVSPQKALFGLLAAAIIGVVYAYLRWEKRNERMVEALKKSQAEIYNLRKKATDLKSLGDEYDTINKKINKTNEDLERQKEIIEQIGDISEGLDPNAGAAAVADFIEKQHADLIKKADKEMEDAIKKAEKSHKNLANAYKAAVGEGDVTAQQTLLMAQAMREVGYDAHQYSEYLKDVSEEEKNLAYTRARLALEQEKTIYKPGDRYQNDGTRITVVDQEATEQHRAAIEEAKDLYTQLAKQDFEKAGIREQFKLIEGLGTISEEVWEMLKELIPGIANADTAMEMFGTTTVETLNKLLSKSNLSGEYIIELTNLISQGNFIPEELKKGFLEKVLTDGAKAGEWLGKEFVKMGKSSTELYHALSAINGLTSGPSLIDLDGVAQGIGSIYTNIEELNKMLMGQADFKMDYIYEMLQAYPELYDVIASGEEITAEKIEEVAAARTQAFREDLEQKRLALAMEIKNLDNAMMALEESLVVAMNMNRLSLDEQRELEDLAIEDKEAAFVKSAEYVARKEFEIAKKSIRQRLEMELDAAEGFEKNLVRQRLNAVDSHTNEITLSSGSEEKLAGHSSNLESVIREQLSALASRRKALIDEDKALEQALISLDNFGTLQGLSAKKGAEAAKAAKEYEGKITALYIAMQQLAALEHELSDLEVRRKYTKSGEEYVALTKSINEGLLEKNKVLSEINRLQGEEQQYTLDNLGSLNKYVRVVNGKLKIAISDYNKLTDNQKKLIDETITNYDQLTDSINQNSISIQENTAEIEANNKILRDKTIELHNLLADALKNQKKKELDIIKKGIAEERKLLDERRKLYEDSFNEEDYLDELSELDEERQDVINQLAQLEGATGATANKKRQELLDRKAELDKQYNTKVRDYNREALFESIQMEQEALDEKEQAAQDYYDQYISDTERLQQDINNILEQGVENTVQFLIDHHTSYIGALDLAKEDLEKEWGFLAEQVEAAGLAVDGLPEEWKLKYDIPDFVAITNNVADLVDALKKIPANTSTTHTNYRQNIQLKDQDLNQNKATDWKPVGDSFVQGMALYQKYERTMADGTKQTKTEKIDDYIGATSKPAKTTVSGGSSGQTYMAFASGGEADFTGPMWIDGTKRRPERILSPVQTELFNRMVSQLERSGGPIGQDFNLGPINVSLATGSTTEAREAASRIYEELKSVMKSRGLVANTKITKY